MNIEEGCACPECGEGKMEYPPVEGCSCHINPPCSACTDNRLACDSCGWKEPEPEYTYPPPSADETAYYEKWRKELEEAKKRGHTFPHGGRIFNVDYDSSSGSTMAFKGEYEGPVTAKDIFDKIGDGTFGHRGPFLYPRIRDVADPEQQKGTFSYTKITD